MLLLLVYSKCHATFYWLDPAPNGKQLNHRLVAIDQK